MAKQVQLVAVKVVRGTGTVNAADFMSGLTYVIEDHKERSDATFEVARSIALVG